MPIKRSRIVEILVDEGLRWRHQETWFSEWVGPDFAERGGGTGPVDLQGLEECD